MSNFYKKDLRVSSMTSAELDNIALHQGAVVGAVCNGYAIPDKNIAPRHGYKFYWVNSCGNGNEGILILRGTTPRTRELVRQGLMSQLMKWSWCSYTDADAYYTAAKGVRWAMEKDVVVYGIDNLHDKEAWLWWRGHEVTNNSRVRWQREWDMPECTLSCPRFQSLVSVMLAIHGK